MKQKHCFPIGTVLFLCLEGFVEKETKGGLKKELRSCSLEK